MTTAKNMLDWSLRELARARQDIQTSASTGFFSGQRSRLVVEDRKSGRTLEQDWPGRKALD